MSENLSTKLPKPPDLQPMPSVQARVWQGFSLVLIIGGLALLGAGGWMFYQIQLEASKPPPARILDPAEVMAQVEAEPAQPPAVEVKVPSASLQAQDDPAIIESAGVPASKPAGLRQGDSLADSNLKKEQAAPMTEPAPAEEPVAEPPAPTPAAEPRQESLSAADAKFLEENALTQEKLDLGLAAAPLSLADNPLVASQPVLAPSAAPDAPAGPPPTRIVAESINLDTPVVEVGWQQVIQAGVPTNVWVVADYAAGWHKNSALPGQGGNIVLSGHHNINGEVFRYLVDLEVGDVVSLYVGDQRYDYAVADKFIVKDKGEPDAVRRANARWIGPFNEERLTLVTCWPYNSNTHRLIVIARPVPVEN